MSRTSIAAGAIWIAALTSCSVEEPEPSSRVVPETLTPETLTPETLTPETLTPETLTLKTVAATPETTAEPAADERRAAENAGLRADFKGP